MMGQWAAQHGISQNNKGIPKIRRELSIEKDKKPPNRENIEDRDCQWKKFPKSKEFTYIFFANFFKRKSSATNV